MEKKFKANHIHSIVKKKSLKRDIRKRVSRDWSDFSLKLLDKKLVNIFENFT